MEKIWNSILAFINENGWKIVAMFAIIIIGFLAIKIICNSLKKLFKKRKVDLIVSGFIINIVYVILIIILIVAVFDIINVSTAPFVAVLGAAGLALALSLQDSLSNIAGGIIIIATKPFKKDDYISLEGVEGSVKTINMLNTVLFTFDNKKIVLPNNVIAKSNITNYSAIPTRRLDIKFNVAYGTKIEDVKKVIGSLIKKDKRVLEEPKYNIFLLEQATSSLAFSMRVWVKTEIFWDVYFDMQEGIYNSLTKAGIEIPYSKLDVNIIKKIEL
jgi:small conductance mechanosensitive channel